MRGGRRPRRGAEPEAAPAPSDAAPQAAPAPDAAAEVEITPGAEVAPQPQVEAAPQVAPVVEPGSVRSRKSKAAAGKAEPAQEPAAEPSNGQQLSFAVEEADEILISVPLDEEMDAPESDRGATPAGDAARAEAAEVGGSPIVPSPRAETASAGVVETTESRGVSVADIGRSADEPPSADNGRGIETDLYAEPTPYAAAPPPSADDPQIRLRLARIHLRTGSLALARSELESLSALEALDLAGQLDLAEARWRTGEVHGAGDAAIAYMSAGGTEPLGYVIAAEGHALAGRQTESRRCVEDAIDRSVTGVEAFFAGIKPRAGWAVVQVPPIAEPGR